jgi:hypothetical protein
MFTATITTTNFCEIHNTLRSQDSSVGIAMSCGLDSKGLIPSKEVIFLFTASRSAQGPTQRPIQWAPGFLSPGIKWLGCVADHSPPSSVKVKNGGAIPPLRHVPSWHSA